MRDTQKVLDGTRLDLIRQLREAEHFRMVAEHANDGIVIQDMDGSVVWPNPAYCRIMKRKAEDIIGRNPLEFALPNEDKPPPEAIEKFRYQRGSNNSTGLHLFRNVRGDGTMFWNQINVSIRQSADGNEHAILVCRDVTEQIEHEEKLHEARNKLEIAATHDSLTGLANRGALLRFTEDMLSLTAHRSGNVGLLHMDLDKFKEINDTHGHSAGDATLKHVADALRENVRSSDMVARVGGDEFVVVCPGVNALEDLEELGQSLANAISVPFEWRERTLVCRASIGAALSENDGLDSEELLLRADFALYEAKREGRDQVASYDEVLHQRHTLELRRGTELREAVLEHKLIHYFQPTLNLETGAIEGFETLVRWQHPEDGLIPPIHFLPMAEELGLMAELDFLSMDAALSMKALMDRSQMPGLKFAFNASGELLAHPEFIDRLMRGVLGRGIDPSQVVIEVLETTVIGDVQDENAPARVIAELRDAGFRVMLDDFGVGYAGLAHLAQLAVTGVKIDQSLVRNMMHDETSAKIVATIIELCENLELELIAEGVESHDMAGRLHELGCPILQGYWVSRPMPTEQVSNWLETGMPEDVSVQEVAG
ncbi:putative bifunctional diguanylate cyclase/phosphodiesterase [Aestuariibius sp. HNIBRBA575]|uniref:putative bifunctional diguanylate cyclase/phosphodiesterase n=1 Tax=Aestuariibius sp. HNIBRBA575 TaxID=3233343 RepID=UPI0034A5179B